MSNYHWTQSFKSIYEKGVSLYEKGTRGAEHFFSEEEIAFLKSIGCTAQELYDFIEDWCCGQDPDYETALLVAAVRRDYFLTIQQGVHSTQIVPMDSLPAKEEEFGGVEWLPRIIEKAKIKLHGEMEADLMYGCGGDRRFLKEYDIHPADFLRKVWSCEKDSDCKQVMLEYVQSTKKTVVA